jgi:hypothetical protein
MKGYNNHAYASRCDNEDRVPATECNSIAIYYNDDKPNPLSALRVNELSLCGRLDYPRTSYFTQLIQCDHTTDDIDVAYAATGARQGRDFANRSA